MTKKKKKLSEIKDALLSKTSYLKNNEAPVKIAPTAEHVVEIDKQVFSKIKILANLYGKSREEVVNEALSHYLRLKKLDIDEALKNIVVGSADDE
jgi:hypothetical protein